MDPAQHRPNVLSLTYVDFETPVEFEQTTVDTFGLVEKFGKFQLGIVADKSTVEKVNELYARYETMYPIKGLNVLYLKFKAISHRQRKEILNKGPMTIKISFSCIGYYRNQENGQKYLVFKVNGLGKSKESNFAPSDIV